MILASRTLLIAPVLLALGAVALISPAEVAAQPPSPGTPTSGASTRTAPEGKPAIIERMPLILRDSSRFQIPLHLEPVRIATVKARSNGVISTISARLGERAQAQAEVVRLEAQEQQLELQLAQANLKAAQQTSEKGSQPSAEAAGIAVQLAALRLENCVLKSPFQGIVLKVHVSEGQFVQAGDPLVTIADPTRLRVTVPIESASVAPGTMTSITIEDQAISLPVEAVLPLTPEFEPLRDLFKSVTTGVLQVDNTGGKYRIGQTAYSPLIPRQAVTEVPVSTLSNATEGERKVQVIRDGIVRDVRIQPLGQMGSDYLFVSGRFGAADELVLKSSETLLDGARIVPPQPATPAPKSNQTPGVAPSGSF